MGNYYSEGERIELIIRDSSGGKIDVFKCSIKEFWRIMPVLKKKYGFVFHSGRRDKDLDWLKD